MTTPILIASAPNGAYKTRDQHRQLPVTATQLADTAVAVQAAGASMLHLHVRDADGNHTLAADAYQNAIDLIRAKVGDNLFIQITSEAAGVYDATQQRDAIVAACRDGVDGVSIAPRELFATDDDITPSKKLLQQLAKQKIVPQYILYSLDDINRYHNLRQQKIIPNNEHSVLLVIGRHGEQSSPEILHEMIATLNPPKPNWMVCAFGKNEFACLVEAAKLGGHVRIGFENTLVLKTGNLATDNRELITQFINATNRQPATTEQAKEILRGVPPPA